MELVVPPLRAAARGSPLPSRDELESKYNQLMGTARQAFVDQAGSAAESVAAAGWRERLDTTAAEEWSAALGALVAASREHCAGVASRLFGEVEASIEAGAFDAEGASALVVAGNEATKAYREAAAGPALDSTLCSALEERGGLPAAARLAKRADAAYNTALTEKQSLHDQEVAKRQGLEAVVAGKEELVETLQTRADDLDAKLQKAEEQCEQEREANTKLELCRGRLEQQVAEAQRNSEQEKARAEQREAELNVRFDEAKAEATAREELGRRNLLEAEARLDDSRVESQAMAEQIGELKAAVASEKQNQEAMRQQHEAALAAQRRELDGEMQARQQVEADAAAAAAAAAAALRAEAAARVAADARADCACVVESLVNGVEAQLADATFEQQLKRVSEERNAVKAQLEEFIQKASQIPSAFQEQIFSDTPKWLQAVMAGEAVTKAGGGEGKDGEEEECAIM